MKIKKGDTVEILAGNDKGKQGEVLTVMPKENKIVVKGAKCNKVTRIGYKVEKDEKVRICKKCGATIK